MNKLHQLLMSKNLDLEYWENLSSQDFLQELLHTN